ncbi:type II toxin-antitoxin system death-on-curing family toxin [Stieleria varia]|uniref:Toxin Doc n=1 Tax=Stieleria varia TaxID=2528005 RepID=A0A5C6B0H6_9BACT|nr:type II toxin-antitoxin system death-on-curing family toxin [Stieleria varia]TWU05805.1 Toxin Doc [Stieleria varia]
MRYLTLSEVLELHRRVIEQSGGADGVRDLAGVESAVVQPQMTFGGDELYPTLIDKAAALCFSLVMNHPFVDGNKRIGHAAMETFLVLNGRELNAAVDDAESLFLKLAAGDVERGELVDWITANVSAKDA